MFAESEIVWGAEWKRGGGEGRAAAAEKMGRRGQRKVRRVS